MKKVFTLLMLSFVFSMGANAQQQIRKSWDFRYADETDEPTAKGWSNKTIKRLNSDMEVYGPDKHWRNYESDATKPDNQHFWNAGTSAKNSDGYAVTYANDKASVIPELEGLSLGMSAAKKFVITYNGSQANDNTGNAPVRPGSEDGVGKIPYGRSYLWLNGKNETITFKAYCGQTVRIAVESHAVNKDKLGEARGISLSAEGGSLNAKFSGNPVPTYYTEYEWELNGEPTDLATLTIKSTNGCHIYYIIVGDGVNPPSENRVAYLYSGTTDGDAAFEALKANEDFEVEAIDVTAATITNELLQAYRASIISASVPTAKAAELQSILPYNPMLNLNAAMYGEWGYGEAVATDVPFIQIPDITKDLFANVADLVTDDSDPENLVYGLPLDTESFQAVKIGEYFAGDDTLGFEMFNEENIAIHQHNMDHNGYIYMPQEATSLFANALNLLSDSKSSIDSLSTPKITAEFKDLKTYVVLAPASDNLPKAKVYYTTDGSTPSLESAVYEDTLEFTEPTTIKTFVTAEGYYPSKVKSYEVAIYSQPATPVIAFEPNGAVSTVTISCETADATIWYNYDGVRDTAKSMKYVAPIDIKEIKDITAYAVAGGKVYSELATKHIVIKEPVVRIDELIHFNAQLRYVTASNDTTDYANNTYLFKGGLSVYDQTADPDIDPETGAFVYPMVKDTVFAQVSNPDFVIKSNGQELIYQVLSIGQDAGNDSGYNPATTADVDKRITKNDIQFGKVVSGEPFTGRIETVAKHKAPFDVLTFIGTSSGSKAQMMIQTSTDGVNWQDAADTLVVNNAKRLWSKFVRSIEGEDEVYVRLIQCGGSTGMQVYDIYLLTEGEESQKVKDEMIAEWNEYISGIEDVQNGCKANAQQGIYTINGMRVMTLQRGLNIVKFSDGTTKKVVVK